MSDPEAKVYVVRGRKRVDVTEATKIVLDRLSSSLDWGSGFLCSDDLEAWAKIADALGMDKDAKAVYALVAKGREQEKKWAAEYKEEKRVRERERRAARKAAIPRWVHQARTPDGTVLVELTGAATKRTIKWPFPPEIERPVEWWVDKGDGFVKVAERS